MLRVNLSLDELVALSKCTLLAGTADERVWIKMAIKWMREAEEKINRMERVEMETRGHCSCTVEAK